MKSAWVTGAAGFIGSHLVRRLAHDGRNVCGIDLAPCSPQLTDSVSAWKTGPLELDRLSELAGETGLPEVIFHLAGGSSVGSSLAEPYADFNSTVIGTLQLLEWVRAFAPSVPIVLVSSAAVYGDLHVGPIAEDAGTKPFSPYGAHKFAMETICRGWAGSFGLSAVVVRLFSVYGPGLKKQLLWDLCTRLESDPQDVVLGGTGAELRDWTHVDDVVRALDVAARFATPHVPIINAGTGKAGSVRQIAERVLHNFGKKPDCLSFSGTGRPGDPFSLLGKPSTLDGEGFAWDIDVEVGIDDYVRWFKAPGSVD
jgi:UDP-glucose 4-epimerase